MGDLQIENGEGEAESHVEQGTTCASGKRQTNVDSFVFSS